MLVRLRSRKLKYVPTSGNPKQAFRFITARRDEDSLQQSLLREQRSHIVCRLINPEAVQLQHASSDRSLVASLDLTQHAIHLKEYRDRKMEHPMTRRDMPLSMLADGELYVTDGDELKPNAMEVAKSLVEVLLGNRTGSQLSA